MNILRGFKAIAAFSIIAMLFASCSEDQTSLNINSLPGKAKIIGSLTYSEGTTLTEGGQFVELIKPAANKEIIFTIPNEAYTGNAESKGNSVFKTKTDANGKYEIEIPASIVKATPISIQPVDFTGNFYRVIQENNELVVDTVLVVYRFDSNAPKNENTQIGRDDMETGMPHITTTLYPNQICFADLRYEEMDYQDLEKGYNQYVNLNGKIGMGLKEYHKPIVATDEAGVERLIKNAEVINYFDKSPNTDLIISITYNGYTRYYNRTTDSNGEFSLNIPVKDIQCELFYQIHALPFAAKFANYERTYDVPEDAVYAYDYKRVDENGYYEEDNSMVNDGETNHIGGIIGALTYTVKDQSHRIEAKMMIFHKYDDPHEINQTAWTGAEWYEDIER